MAVVGRREVVPAPRAHGRRAAVRLPRTVARLTGARAPGPDRRREGAPGDAQGNRGREGPVLRGLHSFPFQLNLSSSVHRVTQLHS
jgi:hypothetical protein